MERLTQIVGSGMVPVLEGRGGGVSPHTYLGIFFSGEEPFGGFQEAPPKYPAYGRQSISRPMRIVAPMP